jgi:diaminohydroxyphosphoribosylaminopyrimidine deaminase/5-amino-6-(5-phosphoribosylamino)uracil reductase
MTSQAPDAAVEHAMRRALELAASPGVPVGPNPRVGCVLVAPDGSVVAEGFHRGAGTPHAEVAALTEAGSAARGATAVVTLEPCSHTGRTGPCAEALIAAGVARVVFAQSDPNPVAAGGAEVLRAAGVAVDAGLLSVEARALNRAWTFGHEHDRPYVTWKFATTLDGRSAAADGTSRWISSPAARADTHRLRAQCDVIMVGTGTVAIDDPELTVRDGEAGGSGAPTAPQPLRVVVGERDLPPDRRIFARAPIGAAPAETLQIRTRDPHKALAELHALGRTHVFLEGGPTLAAAFLEADLVDEVVVYVAPKLLGSGRAAVGDLGIGTIADARNLVITDVTTLGSGPEMNVRLTLTPTPAPGGRAASASERSDETHFEKTRSSTPRPHPKEGP